MAVFAVMMALVLVVPVDDVNGAVLIVELVERLRPGVVEVEEILPVLAHEARASRTGNVHVQALAMDVADEKLARDIPPASSRPDRHITPGVGVAAARRSRCARWPRADRVGRPNERGRRAA